MRFLVLFWRQNTSLPTFVYTLISRPNNNGHNGFSPTPLLSSWSSPLSSSNSSHVQAYVNFFMRYMDSLVEAKQIDHGANLVEKVLRGLEEGADRRETGWDTMGFKWPENAVFRGAAVASRIVAMSTPPHCHQRGEYMVSGGRYA